MYENPTEAEAATKPAIQCIAQSNNQSIKGTILAHTQFTHIHKLYIHPTFFEFSQSFVDFDQSGFQLEKSVVCRVEILNKFVNPRPTGGGGGGRGRGVSLNHLVTDLLG